MRLLKSFEFLLVFPLASDSFLLFLAFAFVVFSYPLIYMSEAGGIV